jgi:hypothetical protein
MECNFNIIKDEWSSSKDQSVNYIAKFIKINYLLSSIQGII